MTEGHSIVELADRPIDPRRASIGYALVLLAFAASANHFAHVVYNTLDLPPRALTLLRQEADPEPPEGEPASEPESPGIEPLVVLLIDGLRLDESQRSAPIEALRDRGTSGVVELTDLPTISRPYYHALLTGVPPRGSGVRRNRPGQEQVLDALTDRVRAAGGEVALVAEGLDWMSVLFASPGDIDHHGEDALGASLDAILERIGAGTGPDFTLIHVLCVDKSAHEHGIEGPEHAAALDLADEVVRRVTEATFGRAHFALVSDHGHIRVGGHGGDELEVRRVPFVIVGDGVPEQRIERFLSVEELAPTLASFLGVSPPRSSVTEAAPEIQGPYAMDRWGTPRRARILTLGTEAEERARTMRLSWLWVLTGLLCFMGLGATHRAFGGLSRETLLAPSLVALVVGLVHRFVLDRPFTLSALDDVTRQGYRVAALAIVATVVVVPIVAMFAGRRAGDPFVLRFRRAAAGVGWAALSTAALLVVSVGGTLGPWPPSAFGTYVPVLAFAGGGGAAAASAALLLGTLWSRRSEAAPESEAVPVDQSRPL